MSCHGLGYYLVTHNHALVIRFPNIRYIDPLHFVCNHRVCHQDLCQIPLQTIYEHLMERQVMGWEWLWSVEEGGMGVVVIFIHASFHFND